MKSILFSLLLIGSSAAFNTRNCNQNATVIYTIQSKDTIFTIAKHFNRTFCDLARYNHLTDPELLYPSEQLYIPPESCTTRTPDSSCMLNHQKHHKTTNNCVSGGPHTYYTFHGDTIEKIALAKFNITVESLYNFSGKMAGVNSTDQELEPGTFIKVPQCLPSRYGGFVPFEFTWGTYVDLAREYRTTPGQIFALNPTFNHSETGPGVGGGLRCRWIVGLWEQMLWQFLDSYGYYFGVYICIYLIIDQIQRFVKIIQFNARQVPSNHYLHHTQNHNADTADSHNH